MLQTGTALPETDSTFEFLMATNRDLFAIKKSGTGTGSTEVHVLSAASNYQRFTLQTGTALQQTGSQFEFALASNRNLIAIKKRGTDTGATEVHILSAANNYRSFVLQTGTALHETGDDFEFEIGRGDDLFAIKKRGTGSGRTEVHVLSAASNYQRFSLQTSLFLPEVGGNVSFLVNRSNNDVFALGRTQTNTKKTLYTVVYAAEDYLAHSITESTALPETGENYAFALSPSLELVAIKKYGTGTSSTEIHILKP